MPTYIKRFEYADDGEFVRRVAVAMLVAAVVVQAEDEGTPGHQARSEFAARVLHSPRSWAPIIAKAVAASADAIRAVASDESLQTVVVGLWDAFAINAPIEG